MADGECIHCKAGIAFHSDDLHRSIGWEVPCQRNLTSEEEALMWKALLGSSTLQYEVEAEPTGPRT